MYHLLSTENSIFRYTNRWKNMESSHYEQVHFDFYLVVINSIVHEVGWPRGVMVKAMDCGIVVREFVLQSRNCVHFRANNVWKGMNPLILPAMG